MSGTMEHPERDMRSNLWRNFKFRNVFFRKFWISERRNIFWIWKGLCRKFYRAFEPRCQRRGDQDVGKRSMCARARDGQRCKPARRERSLRVDDSGNIPVQELSTFSSHVTLRDHKGCTCSSFNVNHIRVYSNSSWKLKIDSGLTEMKVVELKNIRLARNVHV